METWYLQIIFIAGFFYGLYLQTSKLPDPVAQLDRASAF